jgi:hypothetical protein
MSQDQGGGEGKKIFHDVLDTQPARIFEDATEDPPPAASFFTLSDFDEGGTGNMTNYIRARLQYKLGVEGDKYYQKGSGIEEMGQRVQQ